MCEIHEANGTLYEMISKASSSSKILRRMLIPGVCVKLDGGWELATLQISWINPAAISLREKAAQLLRAYRSSVKVRL